MEIDAVVENVIGSAIEQAIKHGKGGKSKPRPTAAGYRAILEADLLARGWSITPIGGTS